jgi:gliding motility-associated protein GldL
MKSSNRKNRGFMHWYESYQGKKVVGAIYSLGAAVVIIGALFKIMHFPGAGPMLMVGMGVEAFLFALGCLDKPHTEFHWHNVFPQLLEHGADPKVLEEMKSRPCPTLLGNTNADTNDEAGVKDVAKTAEHLKDLSKVAGAANELVGKLQAAGETAEQFVEAGKAMTAKTAELGNTCAQVNEDMQKVADRTKECDNQVSNATVYLQKLNAIYELQLNSLQAQVDAYKTQTEKVVGATAQIETLNNNVQALAAASTDTLKSHEAYAAGAKQLASQVADLNKVYGNMLNAL